MNEAKNPGIANLPIGAIGDTENTPNANQEIGGPIGEPIGDPDGGPSYWHSRGYLPHLESPEKIQHVTFHLADSLPKAVLDRWAAELKRWPPDKQAVEQRQRVQAWLDAGHGSCILREAEIAAMVQNSFLFFDGQRYRLYAWVVMPNHAHVLFQSLNGWTMAKIVASWKKFTARKICDYRRATAGIAGTAGTADLPIGNHHNANQAIGDPGSPVWHREYWDRYMRDDRHFQQAVEYIHQNPVKAGLVGKAEAWPWSSAYPGTANLPIGRTDTDNAGTAGTADPPIGNHHNANQAIGDPSDDPRGKL